MFTSSEVLRWRGGLRIVLAAVMVAGSCRVAGAGETMLPDGFAYLKDVAPGIRQDMRYARADNFTGAKVPGYAAGTCILARPVAAALAGVHDDLARDGFGLKVFDCFRPTRAVRAFMAWANGAALPGEKAYFPRVSRDRIIPFGYVARRSSHSLGTAVDLTLVRLGEARGDGLAQPAGRAAEVTCLSAAAFNRSADEVDMGTAFDCFDANSHTASEAVGAEQRAARQRLVKAMAARGFANYAKEWWHFSMSLKAFNRPRDFVVQ
jgi:D-alanyl-D-alanine dipeptidase